MSLGEENLRKKEKYSLFPRSRSLKGYDISKDSGGHQKDESNAVGQLSIESLNDGNLHNRYFGVSLDWVECLKHQGDPRFAQYNNKDLHHIAWDLTQFIIDFEPPPEKASQIFKAHKCFEKKSPINDEKEKFAKEFKRIVDPNVLVLWEEKVKDYNEKSFKEYREPGKIKKIIGSLTKRTKW